MDIVKYSIEKLIAYHEKELCDLKEKLRKKEIKDGPMSAEEWLNKWYGEPLSEADYLKSVEGYTRDEMSKAFNAGVAETEKKYRPTQTFKVTNTEA